MNDHVVSLHDRMGDYLDGTLTGNELLQFEKQLKQDVAFRRDFEAYRSTVQACRKLPKAKLSEFGRARLRRSLAAEQRSWRLTGFARPLSYAAAAVLLLSIGFILGQQFREPTSGIYQAMPTPSPAVRLRDAQTGGWLEVEAFAQQVKRSRQNYAVVPQIRIPLTAAQEQVARLQQQVQAELTRHQVNEQTVHFFAPVEAKHNLLAGPEVELWVQPVSVSLPGSTP